MIPLRDGFASRPTRLWFDAYCRFALWRRFHAIRLYGEPLPTPGERLVVAATHASFWDAIVLNDLLRRGGWRRRLAFVDARQVRRHPFFTRAGGFGVDLDEPADRRRGVRYGVRLLREATEPAALAIFPQGRIEPDGASVDGLPRTPQVIARRSDAKLVHVALRYAFWFDPRPELLVATGDSLAAAGSKLDEACATFAPGRRLGGRRGSIKDVGLRRKPPPPDEREAALR